MAPHAHHPGDGRLPGEAAGRRQRALHSAADAGLPGEETEVPFDGIQRQPASRRLSDKRVRRRRRAEGLAIGEWALIPKHVVMRLRLVSVSAAPPV